MRRATGVTGAIRWGYRPIASLASWSFEGNHLSGTFTATLADYDEMGIAQSPLVVVVPAGQHTWRWPVQSMSRDGLMVSMTVGPVGA